jgi:hypothetical protein
VRERQAQWHVFHLQAQPLAEVNDWLHTYQAFWRGSLDSPHNYVKQLKSDAPANVHPVHASEVPGVPA